SAATTTLIVGAGQTTSSTASGSLPSVRRHSGGTAVLATEDVLGLDVLLPRGHALAMPDVVESYRWFGQVWAATLTRLVAAVRLVGVTEARGAAAPPPHLADAVRLACFGTLSPYEVLAEGRKIVGLAQLRRRNVLLQSGIHFTFDASGLAALLAPERAAELS